MLTRETRDVREDIITQAVRLKKDPGPPCGDCPMESGSWDKTCQKCLMAIAWRQNQVLRDWYGHTVLRALQAGLVSIKHVLKEHEPLGGCDCLMQEELTDIRIQAAELDVPEWAEKIAKWRARLDQGEEWTTWGWYLTDMRYTHNLGSPRFQGYLTPGISPEREEQLVLLGDMIYDYIEDIFEQPGEDEEE